MKKMFSVTFFTALLTVFRLLGGLLISKSVAMYVGPQGVAILGQVQNFVGVLNGIATSSSASAVVRFTSEKENEGYDECSKWWKASSFFIFILLCPVIPFTLFFSSNISLYLFKTEQYIWVIYLAVAILPLAVANIFFTSIINGFQNYKKFVSIGMISVSIATLIILLLVIFYGLIGALTASIIYYGIMGIIVLLFIINEPWFKFKYICGIPKAECLKQVTPYVLMALATALIGPVSQTIIRNEIVDNSGWDVAGNWQAVWDISKAYTSIVTIALGTFFLPKISKIHDYIELKKEVKSTLFFVFPIIVFFAIIVFVIKDSLISILFSSDFTSASDLFLFQLLGDIVKVSCWVIAYPMIAKGAFKWFIASEVLFSSVFVISTILLMTYFNVIGVTYAYFLSMVLNLCFMLINFKRYAV